MAATAVILVIATFSGAAYLLLRDRQAAFEAVTTAQANMALGLESDIERNLDIYDLSLRAAAAGLLLVDGSMNIAAQRAVLFDGSTAARYFRPIVIADRSGHVTSESGSQTPRITYIGDRPSFVAQRDHDDLGLLVKLNRRSLIDGQPFLSITRRISGPDGEFAGTVSGGLDLGYFRDMFSQFDLPPGAAITLVGYDGEIVAGYPAQAGVAGRDVTQAGLRARQDGSTSYEAKSAADGIGRVVTVRRVGLLPYFVAIELPSDAVYAHWRKLAWVIAAGIFVFATVCVLLLIALTRELARRRVAERDAVVARDAMRGSERRLSTYVDHLADGILAVAVDADGQFSYERINEAAGRMLGLDPADVIGRHPRDVLPDAVATFVEARWRECQAASGPTHYERTLDGDDGPRVLRFILAPVREGDGTGPVTLILASVRDVTETVALEAQLRQAQRMEAVGRLTAGVAHDFNNMLQTQSSALELLIEDLQDRPGALEYATMALAASERGGSLTHSLLSFSCQQHLQPRAVPLRALFDGLRQMLSLTFGPRIDLRVQTGAATDGAFADRAQLETAILNLCFNARDAMPEGGALTIQARSECAADAALAGMAAVDAVVLAVSDTGSGMAPEVAIRACEPFFTTKAVGQGSGLGLSMVQGFVQQSGGAMRIHTGLGQGTRVEIWLPRATCAVAEAMPVRAPRLAPAGRGQRVLLVDDAPDLLAVTASLLEAAGFDVIQAASGEEALSLLATEQAFDILITDYVMPGIHGGDLASRARHCFPGLPVLVLTGYAEADKLAGLPPEVETVRKPVQAAALTARVSKVLTGAQVAQHAVAAS